MIIEYHRPDSVEEAIRLLRRKIPRTVALGGGTVVSRKTAKDVAVVDLQALPFHEINQHGSVLEVGATVTLEELRQYPTIPEQLQEVIRTEESFNLRHMSTIAGSIVACTGRSRLMTALVAMDAKMFWLPEDEEIAIGNYLPLRKSWNAGRLIRMVRIPLNGKLACESVARSPMDLPILTVAVCQWSSGRTRVALGGFGESPILAMDGPEAAGAIQAARNATLHAEDQWASAEYRSAVVGLLTQKLLELATGRQEG